MKNTFSVILLACSLFIAQFAQAETIETMDLIQVSTGSTPIYQQRPPWLPFRKKPVIDTLQPNQTVIVLDIYAPGDAPFEQMDSDEDGYYLKVAPYSDGQVQFAKAGWIFTGNNWVLGSRSIEFHKVEKPAKIQIVF